MFLSFSSTCNIPPYGDIIEHRKVKSPFISCKSIIQDVFHRATKNTQNTVFHVNSFVVCVCSLAS